MPYIDVSGNRFYYEDDCFADPWTKPEAIWIQHGTLRSSKFFYHWVPRLSRNYRVIRRDLLGFGRSSDWPVDRPWSVDEMLADMIGFMDAIGLEKLHYVGENAGGVLGAAFAAKWPGRFRSLTLVSTPIANPGRISSKFFGQADFRDVFDQLTIDEITKATIAQGSITILSPEHEKWVYEEWRSNRIPSLKGMAHIFPSVELSEILTKIRVPTLFLSPTRSKVAPLEEQRRMCAMVPGARMAEIDGIEIRAEQPEACLDALTDFLDAQSA